MDREVEGTPVVTAVVTWFRPTPEVVDALQDAVAQCAHVVVVDNTPYGEGGLSAWPEGVPASADSASRVRVLRPGSNLGLAGALNLAVHHLPPDTSAVLLLDQDSRLSTGMVQRLAGHLREVGTGAAAPAPWDEREGRYLDPRARLRPEVAEVPVAITSGLLVARAALEATGPFREDFFVDAVDLDFCLRLRNAGWRIVQDRGVHLAHRLGNTRWHTLLGVRVRASHHPDWRLYSGGRNGARLCREHLLSSPRWSLTQAALLAYWGATVAAFEPPRRSRTRLFFTGVLDGWRGAPARLPIPPVERSVASSPPPA
jgi:rhamnosyltransferase